MDSSPLDHSLLLDFYGDLLTKKQQRICDLYWNEDLSLGEIAQMDGLSRQGVWDTLHRAEDALHYLEEKTCLVHRFLERKQTLSCIRSELSEILPDNERSRSLLSQLEELL